MFYVRKEPRANEPKQSSVIPLLFLIWVNIQKGSMKGLWLNIPFCEDRT